MKSFKPSLLPVSRFALAIFAALSCASITSPNAHAVETAFERDPSLPIVRINVAVKAGAASDPDGQSGISNFTAEMLLRGTKSRNKEQIDLQLDQMGAQIEVETRAEALIVRGTVLSSQLDRFLQLMTDLVTQPNFPAQEIRKLKSEVVSGLLEEQGRDQSLASRRFAQFMFNGHPYGKPILGKIKDVEKFSQAQIIQQYDRLFRDKRLLVVGAGDADAAKIQAWAEALGKTRAGGEEAKVVAAPENAPVRRLMIVDKPERTQTQIYGGQIGMRMTDAHFFPMYLANHAFGGGSFVARLMTEIRVKRGWSYGAYSTFRHGLQPRSWNFYLFPAEKDTVPALTTTLQMVQDLHDKGITQAEYEFAQSSLVNSAGFMYNTPKKRVENLLLERTLNLPNGFMKTYGPELAKVKLADVNSAVKEYIKPDKLSILVLATAKNIKEPLAKAAGVPLEKVEVVPYNEE